MACRGVEALASAGAHDIVFIINPAIRERVEDALPAGACRFIDSPCKTRRAQGIRNLAGRTGIHPLEKLFTRIDADLLLCIQGDIEQSSRALIAARRIGLESVSYIALPHRMETMGAKLGALRDRCNRSLVKLPDRYITISKSLAELLRTRGARQPITVVPNGIAIPRTPSPDPSERSDVLGMLGRIEFKQKQQAFMVHTFCEQAASFKDCRLLIAGDGPDQPALEELIARSSRAAEITLQPWPSNPDGFFDAIDMLVIPSRFEGVPLVMLEALARGIPVIGSHCDGMKDTLPAGWTFEKENAASLSETFSRVRETWKNDIGTLRKHIRDHHSIETFQTDFRQAVLP